MKRVFLDMDGVLCEYRMDASMEDMERDGYFRDLRPRPQMVEAVKALVQNGVCEVFVLSAVLPQKAEAAIREKTTGWIATFQRSIPRIACFHCAARTRRTQLTRFRMRTSSATTIPLTWPAGSPAAAGA